MHEWEILKGAGEGGYYKAFSASPIAAIIALSFTPKYSLLTCLKFDFAYRLSKHNVIEQFHILAFVKTPSVLYLKLNNYESSCISNKRRSAKL